MKLAYNKPEMNVENFAANEFIAACGDSGTNYLFECNAGNGVFGSVYLESNGKPGLQTEGGLFKKVDKMIAQYGRTFFGESGFHACGESHEASSKDDFSEGYYLPKGQVSKAQNVIIWRGDDGRDVHCTTKLNRDEWETAKS